MLIKATQSMGFKCLLISGLYCLVLSSCTGGGIYDLDDSKDALELPQESQVNSNAEDDFRSIMLESMEKKQRMESEDETPRGDGSEAPAGVEKDLLEIDFSGLPIDTTMTTNKLNVVVKNVSQFRVQAKLESRCFGFFDKDGTANLPSISLQEGEERTVQLPVERLPLQNLSGANQMHVVAYINKPEFPEEGEVRSSSDQIFYRFSQDYSTAMFFNESVLMEQFNGCLAGLCSESVEIGQILGRIKGDDDVYTDFTLTGQSVEIEEGVYITPPTSKSVEY